VEVPVAELPVGLGVERVAQPVAEKLKANITRNSASAGNTA